jgi:hypothetical protein
MNTLQYFDFSLAPLMCHSDFIRYSGIARYILPAKLPLQIGVQIQCES